MQTDLAHSEELTLSVYKYHNTMLNLKQSCCNPNNSLQYKIQFKILKLFKCVVKLLHYSKNLKHLISLSSQQKDISTAFNIFSY